MIRRDRNLTTIGVVGAVAAAVCCATPLLVTTAGVVSALARSAWETETEGDILSIHAAIGFMLGGGLGLWTGLYYPRRFPASMIGLAVGAVIGGICAAVAAAGTNGWLFVSGSAGIIALGLLARRGQRDE